MTYSCAECGLQGVRLWRAARVLQASETVHLLCVECAEIDQACVYRPEDAHQIGALIPALPAAGPDADGRLTGGFWAWVGAPAEAVRWWRLLPLFEEGA